MVGTGLAVVTIHVVAYLGRAPELALADSRDRLQGALTRRSLTIVSLLLGAVLLIAMLPFQHPSQSRAAPAESSQAGARWLIRKWRQT